MNYVVEGGAVVFRTGEPHRVERARPGRGPGREPRRRRHVRTARRLASLRE
ncbi:MAG: hypothetical protein M3326_03700 [Actinomycetota bacterium]|nr:hypothetical protein [Actinomycetota bacterium]